MQKETKHFGKCSQKNKRHKKSKELWTAYAYIFSTWSKTEPIKKASLKIYLRIFFINQFDLTFRYF